MSFEALQKEILHEARIQAERVASELDTQRQSEEDRIMDKARATEERILQEAEIEADRQARRLHQEAGLAARSAVLGAKQAELEKTKEAFLAQLLALPAHERKHMLSGLLKLLPEDKGTVVAGEHHAEALKELVKGHTLAKETIAGEGGFIFRSKESEMNLTFSQLVSQLFIRQRAAIARRLFA